MSKPVAVMSSLKWQDLTAATRERLQGKLVGLWGAASDAESFESWPIDKQQAMLMLLDRMDEKGLWHLVKRITNVYGEGGTGLSFEAWPMIHSTLSRRRDFTQLMANHKDTKGGFYERRRGEVILHFLFQDGEPRIWSVHFDLYSPVHSLGSAFKHLRHEFWGKVTPNWQMIAKHLTTSKLARLRED